MMMVINKKLFVCIFTTFILSGCTLQDDLTVSDNKYNTETDEISKVTSVSTDVNVTEIIFPDETISSLVIENNNEAVNLEKWLNENGYLYDFNLDGENETFDITYDLIGEINIYKMVNKNFVNWGDTIKINAIYPQFFSIDNLTLYYDKVKNEYFYINEYDMIEKYYNTADVNKYIITEDGLIEVNIAHCDFKCDQEYITIISNTLLDENITPIGKIKKSDLTYYHEGINEYLSQYEKINEITIAQLTTEKANNSNYE